MGLLESGYFIIYKINGCFKLNTSTNPSQKDSLGIIGILQHIG
ncbi:hypothetical protein BGP_1624 [Beggiatoa sp. PS]|nr:hypothetical protein BGP_1624 [Beggiatoa sp. PS]